MTPPRKRVKGLREEKSNAKKLICGCGLTSILFKPGETNVRGVCNVCGDFGFYPRLNNCRFDSERLGRGKEG